MRDNEGNNCMGWIHPRHEGRGIFQKKDKKWKKSYFKIVSAGLHDISIFNRPSGVKVTRGKITYFPSADIFISFEESGAITRAFVDFTVDLQRPFFTCFEKPRSLLKFVKMLLKASNTHYEM